MKLELNIEKISLISGATSGSDLMFIYLKDKIEGIFNKYLNFYKFQYKNNKIFY